MKQGKDFDVQILNEKLIDAMTPGYQAEFDPDEAEYLGAFPEDALSEQDATDSDVDLIASEQPAQGQED